ncbi:MULTISPECIES: cytochrome c oxidase subunit 3 family protein [Thiohalobacter]|nr:MULTISPECIES: cytochrome c oxidase subunit 3 family protein [Thiohalobacter]
MIGRPGRVVLPDEQAQGSAVGEAPERTTWPPGDLAIWIFILAELAVFAIFFAAYAFARMGELELFVAYQQTLDTNLALINTLALITSSYFVVRAVGRIRIGDAGGCIRWLIGALVLGGLFLGVKSLEYAHLFAEGVRLSTNTFYTFYLSLTFFHFLHVVMGMVILAAVAVKAAQGHYGRGEHTGVETGASYWHMVDLVWLILFPLVYVM